MEDRQQSWTLKLIHSRRNTQPAILSGNIEGTGCALHKLPGSLEPSLVPSLRLADVELPVGNSGCYQLVLATFVPIRRPRQNRDEVVLLPAALLRGGLQYVGCCHSIRIEPTLPNPCLVQCPNRSHSSTWDACCHLHLPTSESVLPK